jgi:hypothetical protein
MAVWTKEGIAELLATNNTMVGRSLVQLFKRQTSDEQAAHITMHNNARGFNGVDAQILSSLAEFYMRNDYLSPKQLVLARRKLKKYTGQLVLVANG